MRKANVVYQSDLVRCSVVSRRSPNVFEDSGCGATAVAVYAQLICV